MDLNLSNEIISQAVHFEASNRDKLPADWVEQTIGQFCAVKTGPFGTLLKASEYSELDGVPVISVGEVREGYFRITEHTPLVPEAVQRRLPQYLLQTGDVVFGRKGAVERSALVRKPQAGWFLGSDGIAVRPTGNHCPEYVAAQFQSFKVRQWLSLNSTGTTMASMNQSVLSRVLIPFPPTLAEEQSIAEALTDADALIDSLKQLLTKKRRIKQGAMQELLTGKRRLPGFSASWVTRSMADLFEFYGGLSASRDQLGDVGSCYLHYGDIHLSNKTYVDFDTEHHLMPRLDVDLRRVATSALLRNGDVVFVDASEDDQGVSKHVVIHSQEARPLISGLHTIVARPKSDELADLYKRYCFQAPAVQAQFRFYAVGTKVSGVSKGNIGKIFLNVPSIAEQTQIAACLSGLDAEIDVLESRLTKTRAVKQAMSQALLTGRIRLVEPKA